MCCFSCLSLDRNGADPLVPVRESISTLKVFSACKAPIGHQPADVCFGIIQRPQFAACAVYPLLRSIGVHGNRTSFVIK